MIILVIVLTNYVPEVSVRHEELTLFKNTWYKLHVGGTSKLKKGKVTILKNFLVFCCTRVLRGKRNKLRNNTMF